MYTLRSIELVILLLQSPYAYIEHNLHGTALRGYTVAKTIGDSNKLKKLFMNLTLISHYDRFLYNA